MGNWLSFQKDPENVAAVKKYCESVVFIRFYGQTSSMKGDMDHEETDGGGRPKSELGHILLQLDREIRMATTTEELEITDTMKEIFKKIAAIRVCTNECESVEDCYKKLLEDAENFAVIYRKRGHKSETLEDEHSYYWATRQQMLFGKVIADWLPEHLETKTRPMDPIFGVLLNPTGGRVGPGDTGWMHDAFFDELGPFAYHSAVHDGFGYLKTNHNSGPGYAYLNEGIFGDWSPFGGQYFGLKFWKQTLEKAKPEEAPLEQFILK